MTVGELAKICEFEIVTKDADFERKITGGYCGDLLSWVMGRAKPDSVWITVMGNVNTIAVALLAGVSCIILAEGASLDNDAKRRAEENSIAVFKSEKSAFDIAVCIAKTLKL